MSSREDAIREAVIKHLPCVPTLKLRGSDSLDFTQVNVEALRKALEAAYNAGYREGKADGESDYTSDGL